jgi:hydrogenase maturation protein HypF
MKQRFRIAVNGIVQGVGFRPYVNRLAQRFSLTGSVRNSNSGVSIEVQGARENIYSFLDTLPKESPQLASLFVIETTELALAEESAFVILESSRSRHANTFISPDIATCDECINELLNSSDRRFLYPFINCTNCGPRFTIVRSVPYDRAQTSMAAFPMCTVCQAEYDNPFDRRFHAQPNACWDCGPTVELLDGNGSVQPGEPLAETVRLLKEGSIVAIKGLGGFHLAVDAHQPHAIEELRRRKAREEKPFAVMVPDLETAKLLCHVTDDEATLLGSPQRPIVLLRERSKLLRTVAPDGSLLGVFLPYTPLHHLLFDDGSLSTLVMTSANLSDEPIAIDNDEAIDRLGGIADFFLMHNRRILLRCDDSVVRRLSSQTQFVRRSRGFVPFPVLLQRPVPPILAVGGELKNTICMSRNRYAFLGQHIGDMITLGAFEFFKESVQHFEDILEVRPQVIAHDLHPGYLSTQWATTQRNLRGDIRLVGIQHHHAHIASCMTDNLLSGEVIGVALDGNGYGTDGAVWGGEVLVANLQGFTRAAHLAYSAMPGGDKVVHEPWRMAVSYLMETFGDSWRSHAPQSLLLSIPPRHITIVEQMLKNSTHSPLTSSCGRLFDAVSALVCGRLFVTYEAQAAIELETCCDRRTDLGSYRFTISDDLCMQIQTKSLFHDVTTDLRSGVAASIVSRRFHNGLIDVITEVVSRTASHSGLNRVCLSGGSFQNAILSEGLKHRLEAKGLSVFTQIQVPPGDGGLSLGQLVVAANQI